MPKDNSTQMLALAEQYLAEKNFASAEICLQTILQTDSANSKANELLAYLLSGRGEQDLALKHLSLACESPHCSRQALYSLGSYFLSKQQYLDSIHYLSRAQKSGGNFFECLHDLGLANIGLKKFREGVRYLRESLDLNPRSYEALNNLGAALRNLGEFSESLKYLGAAINANPSDAGAWLNKGVTFDSMGDFVAALDCYDQALRISPSYLEAICNKANALQSMRRVDEAETLYLRVIELSPGDADAHYNYSHLCLLNGNFQSGWEKFEARWHSVDAPAYLPGAIPLLSATQNLRGKKVLVWAEQGLGDTIQFCRYIALLSKHGAQVTLLVQSALAELLKDLDGVERLEIDYPKNLSEFDFQIPLMSLPLLFKTDLTNIPVNIPYILPNSDKVEYWRSQIAAKDRLKVGIVWSGGFRKDSPSLWSVNGRRNIPFLEMAVLQDVEGVDFYSLQKGEPAESEFLEEGPKLWTQANLINVAPKLKDFSDTAALIENLDLVITVDTSTAHLAAAMGKPVWILNRFDACWRWLRDRSDSPWYPSVQLYRQVNSGNWSELMTRVVADLKELVTKTSITR